RERVVAADLLAAKPDRAGMTRDQARNRIQRRGLAAAIGAEQRHHAALGDFERDIGGADQVAIADFEMLDLQKRCAHLRWPPISSIGVWPAAALAARVPR